MQIKQWEDKNLAHFSYAIFSDCEKKIVLIDPSRDPQDYLDYAEAKEAKIVGIIETHPHADFVSAHAELNRLTGAPVYVSSLTGAAYDHQSFDDGGILELGKIQLVSLYTPGHSPDSISVLLKHKGKQYAIFSGDTLFIGDCGRPDLREGENKAHTKKLELSKNMYYTLREKFIPLDDDVILYPAHGAGTLCGKGLSEANSSSMREQKQTNWALQQMSVDEFVSHLLHDQPFVPAYFPFDVELNRKGADNFIQSISSVPLGPDINAKHPVRNIDRKIIVIDGRDERKFKEGHLPNSINIMQDGKFETWLGSIVQPNEPYYLVGDSTEQLKQLIKRAAAIGYEPAITEGFVVDHGPVKTPLLNIEEFKSDIDKYTIVDVRNGSEVEENKLFKKSISIPLHELRQRIDEIPVDKPIVVHCAGGYRSAAGSSIIEAALPDLLTVFDLGEAITQF